MIQLTSKYLVSEEMTVKISFVSNDEAFDFSSIDIVSFRVEEDISNHDIYFYVDYLLTKDHFSLIDDIKKSDDITINVILGDREVIKSKVKIQEFSMKASPANTINFSFKFKDKYEI